MASKLKNSRLKNIDEIFRRPRRRDYGMDLPLLSGSGNYHPSRCRGVSVSRGTSPEGWLVVGNWLTRRQAGAHDMTYQLKYSC